MDALTFRLAAVVKTKAENEDFEGPLSLILQLLSKNKVEIRDISVSDILAQYLDYLAAMERMDLEVAGEFVEMASYLLYIKAKTLLEGTKEVEELDTLISSLEEQRRKENLQRVQEAARKLGTMFSLGEGLFTREPEPLSGQPEYRHSHQPVQLSAALLELLGREKDALLPAKVPVPTRLRYPIGEKSEEILLCLREKGSLSLRSLFGGCRSRSELAASLMAVLELYRGERVSLRDTENGVELVKYEE